jgi:hypothetical protein
MRVHQREEPHIDVGHRPEVPVYDGPGGDAGLPATSTMRGEMALSGRYLLAAAGQIMVAAHGHGYSASPTGWLVWESSHSS